MMTYASKIRFLTPLKCLASSVEKDPDPCHFVEFFLKF